MQARRLSLLAIAALACASAASPAAAQSIEELLAPGDPAKLLAAFKAICVDPGDDPQAQGAAAMAAPWNLKRKGKSKKLGTIYEAFPLQVTLGTNAGSGTCDATSVVPEDFDIAKAAPLANSVLGTGEPTADAARQRLTWPGATPDGRSILLGVMPSSTIKIAVLVAYKGKLD